MIIDTDVLIWYMRGNKRAYNVIEREHGFFFSVIKYIELVQGMRNQTELTELRRAFREWNTKILYINEEISSKAHVLYRTSLFESFSPTCRCFNCLNSIG